MKTDDDMSMAQRVLFYAGKTIIFVAVFAATMALLFGIFTFVGNVRASVGDNAPAPITIPAWLYPMIGAGLVQGLVTYGMMKVKFDWLFSLVKELTTKQAEDFKTLSERIDRTIENRRATDRH